MLLSVRKSVSELFLLHTGFNENKRKRTLFSNRKQTPETSKKTDNSDVFTLFGEKTINSKLLKPNLENSDPNSYFYNKKTVFTGDLQSMRRKEATEIIFKLGADINVSISRKTEIVIIGEKPGPSKLKKIEQIIEQGHNIEILTEEMFLSKLTEIQNEK